jgi:hypothetical protein
MNWVTVIRFEDMCITVTIYLYPNIGIMREKVGKKGVC